MALDVTTISIACNLLIFIITFAFLILKHRNMFEYSLQMLSVISSFLRRRPRLTCVGEVDSFNHTSSWSPPSSSSNASQIKYDVFISFRGSDTRRGFLSHLLKALSQRKIEAYVDYKLKEGDELSQALYKAIQESQIALVIFSEDYASSRWCLEELVKITECRRENGQIVIPIFYKVDPSDVRHQRGCYENAFAKHEKSNTMNVQKWRTALTEVANLSGFHSSNIGTEDKLIEEIVQRLLARLNHIHQMDLEGGLVGINKQIADLESLIICNGSEDVRAIGIWGMGGIGKTTIAGALYGALCSEFEDHHFLENVREQSEKDGITRVRDKLLSILLKEKDLNIGVPNGVPGYALERLRRKKILVILDDVNNIDQVRKLVGEPYWLGPGSRIIITTRDKHVVCKADAIYKVKALEFDEALKLLSLHAFNRKCIQMNCYNSVMLEMVQYAQGVPLALKVLGSFLYDKSVEEWESQLQKFQKIPFPEIQNILRLSYEGVDQEERNIFLYLVCFFDTYDNVKILLDACGYSTTIALRTLHDRALISTFGGYTMHDLIREMGREIVREQSVKALGKQSHLWDPNDIVHVLKHDEGTKYIESITLDMSKVTDLSLSPHSFARMVNLKLLRFHHIYPCNSLVHLPESLGTLPDELKLFHWDNYPWKSLPATFNAKNLVELCMPKSHVEKFWDGVPDLTNLTIVELSGSEELIELPNFSKASRLKTLRLCRCTKLLSVHSSIFYLPKLFELDLEGCERLENLPAIEALPSSERCRSKLECLNLHGCESLKHLPDGISELRFLKRLTVGRCKQLDVSNLHILFDGLSSLEWLCLDGCSNLYELPENISKLSLSVDLLLSETNVKSLPESIKHLSKLRCLGLDNCRRLRSLPELPASVCWLYANDCTSLERVFTPTPELLEEHIRLFEIEPPKDCYGEFSFKNCPNLDEDALDPIFAYVHCCNERRRAI